MANETSASRIPQNIWTIASFDTNPLVIGAYRKIFTAKLGDAGITLNDTNFKTASRVPYLNVIVYGIQAEIYNDGDNSKLSGADINQVRQNISLTITKNTVKRVFAMLHNIPAGNDTTGAIADGNATTTIINATNGTPIASNYYGFKTPEMFSANDQIEGTLTVENGFTPTADLKVRITLLSFVEQKQGIGA